MHAPEVEVTLRRYIRDIRSNPLLLAQLPYPCRSFWIVHCGEDHGDGRVIEVGGFEFPVNVFDLFLLDAVGDFGVEPIARADHGYSGVGIE